MKKELMDQLKFEVECLPEEINPYTDYLDSGDKEQDRKDVDAMMRDLNRGNAWAWCCVKVIARFNGFSGCDYLGACSYKDQADFEKDGYFEDMKYQAIDDLKKNILSTIEHGKEAEKLLKLFE